MKIDSNSEKALLYNKDCCSVKKSFSFSFFKGITKEGKLVDNSLVNLLGNLL